MDTLYRKDHWENIYLAKKLEEVSWFQPKPTTSLDLILKHSKSKDEALIDIGGGDSFLPDNLLDSDFNNLTILDISLNALKRAQERLGTKAEKVDWVHSDVTEYEPTKSFDIWHDRAAFHFLTKEEDRLKYRDIIERKINKGGILIIAGFSTNGPLKCSGIEIKQHSIEDFAEFFKEGFELKEGFYKEHPTPFNTTQEFTFAVFERK